jgi:hypothetical protein
LQHIQREVEESWAHPLEQQARPIFSLSFKMDWEAPLTHNSHVGRILLSQRLHRWLHRHLLWSTKNDSIGSIASLYPWISLKSCRTLSISSTSDVKATLFCNKTHGQRSRDDSEKESIHHWCSGTHLIWLYRCISYPDFEGNDAYFDGAHHCYFGSRRVLWHLNCSWQK